MLSFELIGKIFGLGVIVIVADMILVQAGRKDMAFGITLGGVVIMLFWIVPQIGRLFSMVTNTFNIQ